MGKQTGISWTGATWNPWHGCLKVSPGCKFCYMYAEKKQYGQDPMIVQRSKTKFKEPLKWTEPELVFTCSWSDWFIEQADQWRPEAWEIIKQTPHLTYQILTKRPERIADHLPADWDEGYRNVWLGVSAENQEYADLRIPQLLAVPAHIRFVSYEPALGPVSLQWAWISKGKPLGGALDWIICGGESGNNRREFQQAWAEHIMEQCKAAGVAFFMKQMGGRTPTEGKLAIPEHLRIQEFPR